ncbi:MAG: hypothetical protein GY862_05170 [Gammaproteobacteria bacterium]|nr:hypothetical protein [Gammaproteobacteria bacterium]
MLRDGYEFKLSPGLTQEKHKRNWRSPSTITEPAGRRLIFLISDCVSDSWRDGTIARQVRDWFRYGPVALLQVLPEHLWRRTDWAPPFLSG